VSQEKKASSLGLAAGVAAAVVILGLAGVFWVRSHRAEPPPPVAAAPAPAETAPPVVITSNAPAAPVTPPPAAAPVAVAPKPGVAPADPGRAGTSPAASAATARNAAAPPSKVAGADETPVEVREVRMLTVSGKKAKDDEVFVSFANGQVSVLPKERGTPLVAWPYKSVLHATYIKARDPRWDTSFASPPDGLDVGGVLRTSKNWFVLQNHDGYVVLRLSDANYARVIELIEARAGIRVARPQPDSDKN
jgi:hypothetical protein